MASLFREEIQSIKGVGRQRARLFQKLGVPSVGALLRFYPRAYEDLSHPVPIRSAPLDEPCAVRATVTQSPAGVRVRGGMTVYKGRADDGESSFELTFFNNPYVAKLLKEGETYLFYGKVTADFLRRGMTVPEFFPAGACPPIRPVYRQTDAFDPKLRR